MTRREFSRRGIWQQLNWAEACCPDSQTFAEMVDGPFRRHVLDIRHSRLHRDDVSVDVTDMLPNRLREPRNGSTTSTPDGVVQPRVGRPVSANPGKCNPSFSNPEWVRQNVSPKRSARQHPDRISSAAAEIPLETTFFDGVLHNPFRIAAVHRP
jgi:hypothetical protein